MADYSQFIFGSLDTIGQRIAQNRADKLAAEQWDKSYSQRLLEDQTNWDWRQKEADRAQANADRSYSLDLMKANGTIGGGDEYGLSPLYATGPDESVAAFQTSKSGKVKQIDLPPGYKFSPNAQKVDLGTEWGILDRNGNVISRIPKDVSGEAAAKTVGEGQGKAKVDLPTALHSGNYMLGLLDQLKNDPYLPSFTGPIEGRSPNVTGNAARVQANLDQIFGATFLQAYQQLKGGGQITEIEGQKAEAAYNKLKHTEMSDPDYYKAILEFEKEVKNLMALARARAIGAADPIGGEAPAPPQLGPQDAAAVIDAARSAIAAGKDPAAVADRLRQLGIDPSQLGQ